MRAPSLTTHPRRRQPARPVNDPGKRRPRQEAGGLPIGLLRNLEAAAAQLATTPSVLLRVAVAKVCVELLTTGGVEVGPVSAELAGVNLNGWRARR